MRTSIIFNQVNIATLKDSSFNLFYFLSNGKERSDYVYNESEKISFQLYFIHTAKDVLSK